MSDLTGQILGASDQIGEAVRSLNISLQPFAILDILIVALLFYWIYFFLRETRAMRILYGIIVLIFLLILGRLLDLTLLNFVMRYLATSVLIALPVVFQPELRAALERLGRTRFVTKELPIVRKIDIQYTVDTIVSTVSALSRRKIGALVAISGKTGLREFVETGIEINADLSRELLWNIFTPKTPLHDGAVIIVGNKVVAASVRLPLSEEQFSEKMGTRHRAAIGLSGQTDALVVVVSEETGRISVALEGTLLTDLSPEQLKEQLLRFYHPLSRKESTTNVTP